MCNMAALPALQGSVSAQQLDLADLPSVRAAAAALQRLPRIDYLILNAGVMVMSCAVQTLSSCCRACSFYIDQSWVTIDINVAVQMCYAL